MDIWQTVDWDVNQRCGAENISFFGSGPSSMKPQILISAPASAPAPAPAPAPDSFIRYLFRLK
jgi:hypothetical protein